MNPKDKCATETHRHTDKMEDRQIQNSHLKFFSVTLCLCGSILCLIPGCITGPSNPAATQPATAIDPDRATPGYWIDQPPAAQVTSDQFQPLWDACRKSARDRFFQIDRDDYRDGLLTTFPVISEQFFEPWRRDVGDGDGLLESSLATVRRTLRFEFVRNENSWTVTPKVLIERYSLAERRITSVTQYRTIVQGSVEPDRPGPDGTRIPNAYWYATGRDTALEKTLADEIRDRLK